MKVQELATLMTRRFDAMDQQFDSMDNRSDAMNQRMERLENNFVTLTVTTSDIKADVTMLRLDLRVLDGRGVKVDGDIRAMGAAFEELRGSLRYWCEALDIVRERVDRHKVEGEEQLEQIRSVLMRR